MEEDAQIQQLWSKYRKEKSDGRYTKEKKLNVKTWQIAFILAIVVFIIFLLLNSSFFGCWLLQEVPNPYYRTITAGLILAVIVFIVSGTYHHYVCPVKEKNRPGITPSPLGVIAR